MSFIGSVAVDPRLLRRYVTGHVFLIKSASGLFQKDDNT